MTPRKPHLTDTVELMHINPRRLWQRAEDLQKFKPDKAPALSGRGGHKVRGLIIGWYLQLIPDCKGKISFFKWCVTEYINHTPGLVPGIFTGHSPGSPSVLKDLDLPPIYKPSAALSLSLWISLLPPAIGSCFKGSDVTRWGLVNTLI